jgi:hypothetical protein
MACSFPLIQTQEMRNDILTQNGYTYVNKQPDDSPDGGFVYTVGLYFVRISKTFVLEKIRFILYRRRWERKKRIT